MLGKSESVPVRVANTRRLEENKTELTPGLHSEAVAPLTTNYLDSPGHSQAGGQGVPLSQGVHWRGVAVSGQLRPPGLRNLFWERAVGLA